jgi:hypothetical protein
LSEHDIGIETDVLPGRLWLQACCAVAFAMRDAAPTKPRLRIEAARPPALLPQALSASNGADRHRRHG